MRAGDLDREITVEQKTVTQDATYGTEGVTWAPLVTEGSPPVAVRFRAQVLDVLSKTSGEEMVALKMNQARNLTRIRMRYRDDVDTSMRIRVHGNGTALVYQIIGGPTAYGGRQEYVEFLCERFAP